jgi:3-dehydroquinate dehydratase type I
VTARIAVSVLPKTMQEALQLIEKAENANADMIEVRLDCLGNRIVLADLAAHGKTPKIATYKMTSVPGVLPVSEAEQRKMLLKAAKSGFEFVDIELSGTKVRELVSEVKARGAKSIVSFHDFSGTPSLSELKRIFQKEINSKADVCKIVTTAKRMEDNLTVLDFTSSASASGKSKIVCFAMDELGKVSRLLSPLFGGFFTFASLEHGSETASGQMSIQEMRAVYESLGPW